MNKERRDEIHAFAASKIAFCRRIAQQSLISSNSTHESDLELMEMVIECLQALDDNDVDLKLAYDNVTKLSKENAEQDLKMKSLERYVNMYLPMTTRRQIT